MIQRTGGHSPSFGRLAPIVVPFVWVIVSAFSSSGQSLSGTEIAKPAVGSAQQSLDDVRSLLHDLVVLDGIGPGESEDSGLVHNPFWNYHGGPARQVRDLIGFGPEASRLAIAELNGIEGWKREGADWLLNLPVDVRMYVNVLWYILGVTKDPGSIPWLEGLADAGVGLPRIWVDQWVPGSDLGGYGGIYHGARFYLGAVALEGRAQWRDFLKDRFLGSKGIHGRRLKLIVAMRAYCLDPDARTEFTELSKREDLGSLEYLYLCKVLSVLGAESEIDRSRYLSLMELIRDETSFELAYVSDFGLTNRLVVIIDKGLKDSYDLEGFQTLLGLESWGMSKESPEEFALRLNDQGAADPEYWKDCWMAWFERMEAIEHSSFSEATLKSMALYINPNKVLSHFMNAPWNEPGSPESITLRTMLGHGYTPLVADGYRDVLPPNEYRGGDLLDFVLYPPTDPKLRWSRYLELQWAQGY